MPPTLQEIQIHHDNGMRQAENIGLQDGKVNRPNGDNNANFASENIVKGHYDGILALVQAEIGTLGGLQNEYQTLSDQLTELSNNPQILDAQIQLLSQQRDIELQDLQLKVLQEDNRAINHPEYQGKKHDYIRAQTELDQIKARLGRSNLNKLDIGLWYYLLLILLGIGELPINRQVFQIISDNVIETTITALILIVGVPVASHLSGIYLKRRSEKKEYFVLFIVVLLVVIVTFTIIAYIRVIYMNTINEDAKNGISTVMLFFFISFLIYSIGTWLSYSIHDESKEFEESYKKFEKTKEAFNLAENALDDTRRKIQQENDRDVQYINQAYNAKRNEILNTPATLRKKIQSIISEYNKLRSDILGKQRNIGSVK